MQLSVRSWWYSAGQPWYNTNKPPHLYALIARNLTTDTVATIPLVLNSVGILVMIMMRLITPESTTHRAHT